MDLKNLLPCFSLVYEIAIYFATLQMIVPWSDFFQNPWSVHIYSVQIYSVRLVEALVLHKSGSAAGPAKLRVPGRKSAAFGGDELTSN